MKGSIGIAYLAKNGERLLLTNAHVVAGFNSRAIGSIVRLDAADRTVVGTVYRSLEIKPAPTLNVVDASLIRPTDAAALYRVGEITVRGEADLQRDGTGFFYISGGRRKDCLGPSFVRGSVPITYGSRLAWFTRFAEMTVVSGPVEHGDSGSVLLRQGVDGTRACGLVFAGVPKKSVVYVQPLAAVVAALCEARASALGRTASVEIVWPT